MIETIKFTAAKSGTEHDGRSMIVMNKGKVTEAPASAEELLRDRGYISGKVRPGRKAKVVDDGAAELAAAIERANEAEAELAKLKAEGEPPFELVGFTYKALGKDTFEISREGDENVWTVSGEDNAKAQFAQLVAEAVTAPADDGAADDGSGSAEAPPAE